MANKKETIMERHVKWGLGDSTALTPERLQELVRLSEATGGRLTDEQWTNFLNIARQDHEIINQTEELEA